MQSAVRFSMMSLLTNLTIMSSTCILDLLTNLNASWYVNHSIPQHGMQGRHSTILIANLELSKATREYVQ
jgi:hypothetical protein